MSVSLKWSTSSVYAKELSTRNCFSFVILRLLWLFFFHMKRVRLWRKRSKHPTLFWISPLVGIRQVFEGSEISPCFEWYKIFKLRTIRERSITITETCSWCASFKAEFSSSFVKTSSMQECKMWCFKLLLSYTIYVLLCLSIFFKIRGTWLKQKNTARISCLKIINFGVKIYEFLFLKSLWNTTWNNFFSI